MLPAIIETVAQALKLPYAAIALKRDDELHTEAVYGTPVDAALTLPLVYQAETIGQLTLGPRQRGETFTPADRRLLEDLARQIGVAAHAVQLTADLQRSRERLVTTREEERRRLRRDLHDGLGSALTSLMFKLDATDTLLDRDLPAARSLLAETRGQMQASITDIRRLVYDLRPPTLDEWGLVDALREQVAHSALDDLQVTIEAPDVASAALSRRRGGGVSYRAGGAGECRQACSRHELRHPSVARRKAPSSSRSKTTAWAGQRGHAQASA